MASADVSVATNSSKKKKKKSVLKSIAKGMSFKKKKKFVDDDTVVGVAVESNAGDTGSKAAVSSAPAKPIQVVLLLMDPHSRRFELLQLEFDSNKALVSDVLHQVQSSATEDTLRNLKYGGVCDQDGHEMIASLKLSNFCKGSEIVMGIPEGMTGSATLKLSQPILSDPKVVDMLRPCGVKIKRVTIAEEPKKKMEKIAEEDRKETKKVAPPTNPKQTPPPKKQSTTKTPSLFGVGIMALLFFTVLRHIRVTTKIESGDILLPGQWKSQCGFWDVLPEKLSEKYCDTKSSSTLEMGRDGTLRYYTKGGTDGEKIESWILSKNAAQCSGDEDECVNGGDGEVSSATFVKDGNSWYVDLDGKRSALRKDVVKDFMSV